MKGKPCPYTPKTCQEEDESCTGCPMYLNWLKNLEEQNKYEAWLNSGGKK